MMTAPPTTDSPARDSSHGEPDAALGSQLRAITTWDGGQTELWRAALSLQSSARASGRNTRKLLFVVVSVAAILVLAAGVILPSLGKARSVKVSESVGSIAIESDALPRPGSLAFNTYSDAPQAPSDEEKNDRPRPALSLPRLPAPPPAPNAQRSVIRKATVELAVPDTRETFAKCQHLLRADLGEFVEGSSLTGQDKDAHAQLTLRVAVSRLDEMMNQLRELGKVDNENSTGDDVSAQVVDLDANLRNAKAVEAEVLKLLDSRKDAQLKDVLELRDKLSMIRATIETLQGRRDTLGRQIALASILVIIRPDNAPKPEPKPASMFDSFSGEMNAAWSGGLTALTQTLAFLVRVAVGGLVWWLLLIAAIAIVRRVIRRWIPDPASIPASV